MNEFKDKVAEFVLQRFGLHPLVALAVIGVDMMLFASDALGPVGWAVSCIVGFLLMIPCTLIQHYAYKDEWIVAASKGALVAILTAIPTPLPAFITGLSGLLGTAGTIKKLLLQGEEVSDDGTEPEPVDPRDRPASEAIVDVEPIEPEQLPKG